MQVEDQRNRQHRQRGEQRRTQPDVGGAVASGERMGIGHLAEQDARRRHELFKGQGTANQQTGEAQFAEHHPVEQPGKDHRQTSQTALKQAEADQTGKGEGQLEWFS